MIRTGRFQKKSWWLLAMVLMANTSLMAQNLLLKPQGKKRR